jgi:predicted metal-dependent phosphoesterase TrpH
VIDLHLHTTASDGTSEPAALVRLVRHAGIRAFSVTDHDTIAALAECRALAHRWGLEFIGGIEITAVLDGADVHVLGYGFDEASPRLLEFLHGQRADRVRRAREMGRRLGDLGVPVDLTQVLERARHHGARSVGRPALADALVRAGHASSRQHAFDRFLGRDRPAYVPRIGATPREVVQLIVEAGGLPSIAHPGLLPRRRFIRELPAAGLAALEVYHSDHPPAVRQRLAAVATRLGLARTGGSDFHGDEASRPRPLGGIGLPRTHYERLLAEGRRRGCAALPPRSVRV